MDPLFLAQTRDLHAFAKLDKGGKYSDMLPLCNRGEYVKDVWRVLLGTNLRKWNLLDDDRRGIAAAKVVADVVFAA